MNSILDYFHITKSIISKRVIDIFLLLLILLIILNLPEQERRQRGWQRQRGWRGRRGHEEASCCRSWWRRGYRSPFRLSVPLQSVLIQQSPHPGAPLLQKLGRAAIPSAWKPSRGTQPHFGRRWSPGNDGPASSVSSPDRQIFKFWRRKVSCCCCCKGNTNVHFKLSRPVVLNLW